jgi:hypothetical protein
MPAPFPPDISVSLYARDGEKVMMSGIDRGETECDGGYFIENICAGPIP